MKVLVVSTRFPWPSYSGDRRRASTWLEALAPNAQVALVAPPGEIPAGSSPFRFFPARSSRFRFARAFAEVLRRGRPIQSLLAAPFAWDRAIDEARQEMGPFDATILVLSRADAWVRPSLDGGVHILDSIDSLRLSAAERGRAASGVMRQFWRSEERRLARAESELATAYDHVVLVNEDETGELGGNATTISNGVRISAIDASAPRRFDIGFWGRLAYFANRDAAGWLLNEIVPPIREQHPGVTIVMGGADAPRGLRAQAERAGVTFQSPVADVAAFARDVRVAVAPMRYGTGQSNKLIEAAEAGCAIVATPRAIRGLPHIARHATVCSDVASIAAAAIALVTDDRRRAAMAKVLRLAAEEHYSQQREQRHMALLAGAIA